MNTKGMLLACNEHPHKSKRGSLQKLFIIIIIIIIIIINGKDDKLCSTIFGLDGHALISYAISVVTQLIKQAHCKSQ